MKAASAAMEIVFAASGTMLAFGLAALISYIALFKLPVPFFWIALGWGAACASRMRRSKRPALWFNLAAVILIFGFTELALAVVSGHSGRHQEFSAGGDFFELDGDLGICPSPGAKTESWLRDEGHLVYDVVYSIDADGLRVGPPARGGSAEPCVLFFGGSFTFGEGVNDDQAMPYVAGIEGGERLRTLNFGFFGYGPHQMLAAIESGRVARAARCKPIAVVYLAISHHVMRAAGKWTWERYGPRFAIAPDGSVVRRGNFDDGSWLPRRLDRFLRQVVASQSLLLRRLLFGPYDASAATEDDIRLFFAIIDRSRDLLHQLYPEARFYVLYWDEKDPDLFRNRRLNYDVHPISAILPDRGSWKPYKLDGDAHPNSLAHELIGRYVATQIVADGR
jgi:hypothetical protein